jgi:hypothetical protein
MWFPSESCSGLATVETSAIPSQFEASRNADIDITKKQAESCTSKRDAKTILPMDHFLKPSHDFSPLIQIAKSTERFNHYTLALIAMKH